MNLLTGILHCVFRYSPNKRWHIDTMMKVLTTVSANTLSLNLHHDLEATQGNIRQNILRNVHLQNVATTTNIVLAIAKNCR